MFFAPIASPIPPSNTHPHGHTATHPYQILHCSIIRGADAGLAIPAVASHSKSAWRIPSSDRQQRVSQDGSSARSPSHAANNGCACCSFGGFRLSPKPPTRWDESSSSRCSRRQRETQLPTDFACCTAVLPQYSLTPTASRKSTKTIK